MKEFADSHSYTKCIASAYRLNHATYSVYQINCVVNVYETAPVVYLTEALLYSRGASVVRSYGMSAMNSECFDTRRGSAHGLDVRDHWRSFDNGSELVVDLSLLQQLTLGISTITYFISDAPVRRSLFTNPELLSN